MATYIQTRGHGADYTFLGDSPVSQWWRDYRTVTAFEDPTILIERDGNSWRCLVSGIPSTRRDRVGSVIRYTVVLDGVCGGAQDSGLAKRLVEVAADATIHQPVLAVLTSVLDEHFPKDFIEDCFARRDDAAAAEPVRQRLEAALLALPPVKPASSMPSTAPESWLGALPNEAARKEFVRRAHAIIDGSASGRACVLNLIDSADDASSLLAKGTPLAMLATVGQEHFGSLLVPLVEKKKLATAATNGPTSRAYRLKIALIAGLTLLVAAFGIWFATLTQPLRPGSPRTKSTDSSEKPGIN
jgi:hypothetical protein